MDQNTDGQNHFIDQMIPRPARQKHNLTNHTGKFRKTLCHTFSKWGGNLKAREAQEENHFGNATQVCPGQRKLGTSKHQELRTY